MRTQRLADYTTRVALDDSQFAQMEVTQNRDGNVLEKLQIWIQANLKLLDHWLERTLFRLCVHGERLFSRVLISCDLDNMRRALLWQTSVFIWQLGHDGNILWRPEDLPNSDSLPPDVYTNKMIAYYPIGFAGYFADSRNDTSEERADSQRPEVRFRFAKPKGFLYTRVPERTSRLVERQFECAVIVRRSE